MQRLQSFRFADVMSALMLPDGQPGPVRCEQGMSALKAIRSFASPGRPKSSFEASVEGI
jgi:hypothetical protein